MFRVDRALSPTLALFGFAKVMIDARVTHDRKPKTNRSRPRLSDEPSKRASVPIWSPDEPKRPTQKTDTRKTKGTPGVIYRAMLLMRACLACAYCAANPLPRARTRAYWSENIARRVTDPHKFPLRNNALQGRKTRSSVGFAVPLNLVGGGGFRWPARSALTNELRRNIVEMEVGGQQRAAGRTPPSTDGAESAANNDQLSSPSVWPGGPREHGQRQTRP
jgi:hypothetical protein